MRTDSIFGLPVTSRFLLFLFIMISLYNALITLDYFQELCLKDKNFVLTSLKTLILTCLIICRIHTHLKENCFFISTGKV